MSHLLKAYGSDPVRGACNSIGQPEKISQVREPRRKPPKDGFYGIPTPDLIVMRDRLSAEIKRRGYQPKKRELTKTSARQLHLDIALIAYANISLVFSEQEGFNSSGLLAVPNLLVGRADTRAAYLPALIKQDWNCCFPERAVGNERFYVYAHIDPTSDRPFICDVKYGGHFKGTPFYIGKGQGNRAYDLSRNQGHGKVLRALAANGYDPSSIVKILFSDLSESKAFEIESKLIYFFGTVYQKERQYGSLYNLDIPRIPQFCGVMQAMPEGINPRHRYQPTRKQRAALRQEQSLESASPPQMHQKAAEPSL